MEKKENSYQGNADNVNGQAGRSHEEDSRIDRNVEETGRLVT